VLDAYGWSDIPTDCKFLLDYEIDEEEWGDKKKPYRYRWPDEVRDEVLPQATTKSNRAPARVTTQTANAMSSPRRRIPAAQASGGAHRTERPSSLIVEPETRPTTIDGWIVRDVIGNTAVLEGPNGVRKVALGDVLPELGKVDSILRWGKRWIVSTERGLISTL